MICWNMTTFAFSKIKIAMTIKELKNNILLALYERYKNGDTTPIDFDKLCKSNSIIYDSEQQLSDVVEKLKSQNYLNAIMYINNRGTITGITPDGLQYVEDNLLTDEDLIADGLKDTDNFVKSGGVIDVDIDAGNEDGGNDDRVDSQSSFNAYSAKENFKDIIDSSVEPCFGITALADCYIKQLDKIAEHTNDKFCMLGIFGPWGRGKTYFFNQIKSLLEKRSSEKQSKSTLKYKIVSFNAWKYQDTPAIWAYLYETMYEEGLYDCKKAWFMLKPNCKYILLAILYFLIIWFSPKLNIVSEEIQSVLLSLRIPISIISLFGGIAYAVIKNPFSVYKAIEKHFKRKSYKGTLGIQSDLENDLEALVKLIIREPKKEQLILFVDDIDRCETSKMLSVVNSLRLILENPEIQKRMIVICSIDSKKLIEAYCRDKFSSNKDHKYTEEQKKEARQHIDKLFIFSIGLPVLDQSQQIEYLSRLYNMNEVKADVQPPFSINRDKHSMFVLNDGEELNELTDGQLGDFLKEYLQNNKIEELTPRKIRIIYYRLLFANNIIATGKGTVKGETLKQIIDLSLQEEVHNIDIDIAASDVIGMVVPY